MKIIVSNTNLDELTLGIGSALTHLKDNFLLWDKKVKPTYDMFFEIQPDIVFVRSEDIDDALLNSLEENKNTKLVVYGLTAPSEAKLIIYPKDFTEDELMVFNPLGIPYLVNRPMANIAQIRGGKFNPKLECEVLVLALASQDANAMLGDLYSILPPNLDAQTKVIGDKFLAPEYLGKPDLKTLCDFTKSAKVVVTTDVTKVYDLAANKIFTLGTQNEIFPYFSQGTLREQVSKYLTEDKLRKKAIKEGFKKSVESTVFHFTSEMMAKLGYDEYAKEILKVSKGVINEIRNSD